MDYNQELYISSLFDFSDFLENEFLSDCIIKIQNPDGSQTDFKAHSVILANSSLFFYNVFTSGMQESSEGVVIVNVNPDNVLPKALTWLYNGKIQFSKEELMPLFEVAHFYAIDQLTKELKNVFQEIIENNPKEILNFAEQCLNNEYSMGIRLFYPDFARLIRNKTIPISDISSILTCEDFAEIVKVLHYSNTNAIQLITDFYGSYEGSEEEKQYLFNALDRSDNSLIRTLNTIKPNWLPKAYIK